MAKWFEVTFSKEELRAMVQWTARWGFNHGQMGVDLHERLEVAFSYAQSLMETES